MPQLTDRQGLSRYCDHIEGRVAKLEAFAKWAADVASGNHFDTALALRRIAEEARKALAK